MFSIRLKFERSSIKNTDTKHKRARKSAIKR
jgi:hypothetical protein